MHDTSSENKILKIPNGWVLARLDEFCEIILGQSPPSSTYNSEKVGLPFYQGKAEFGSVYPTPVKWCSIPKKIAEKDDILMSVRAPVGTTNICFEKSCIGRGLAAIRGLDKITTRFILYLCRTFEDEIRKLSTGTTFDAISGDNLKSFIFPLPPLAEQKRIVLKIEELFTKLDAGVSELKQAQAQVKRYRQSVLKSAVTGELTRDWRKSNQTESAEILLKRILKERREKWEADQLEKFAESGKTPKNDDWKKKYKEPSSPSTENRHELPEGWAWINLGHIAWSVKDGPHYSPKYVEKGIPFISGGNVRPEGVDFNSTKYISAELHNELLKRCKPEKGDILYTKGGTTGIARVNTYDIYFNVWVHVAVLKLIDSVVPFYIQHALNSPEPYRQSQRLTHGVGNQDLGLTRMVNIEFAIPSIVEQEKVIEEVEQLLSVADEVEKTIEESLKQAERLRQSILQKAFTGKLVQQDEHDEPASVLLERIKKERETKSKGIKKVKSKGEKSKTTIQNQLPYGANKTVN